MIPTALATAALVAALVLGLSPASPAGAETLCEAFGDPYCPPGQASSDTVPPGGTLRLHAEGFDPFELVDVTLFSNPIHLGTFQADAAGVLDITVTIPAGVDAGAHTISMVGQESGRTVEVAVEVVSAAPSGGGGDLARTGGDTGPLVRIGFGLVAAGVAAAYAARRRAQTAQAPSQVI